VRRTYAASSYLRTFETMLGHLNRATPKDRPTAHPCQISSWGMCTAAGRLPSGSPCVARMVHVVGVLQLGVGFRAAMRSVQFHEV
jgi:hypothetical protein